MNDSDTRMRKPLLAVAVETRRTTVAILAGIVLWAFVSWAITSILAGRGAPFDYAIHNYSIGELRVLLWLGTSFMAFGVIAAGTAFIQLGKSLWRHASGAAFGLRFAPNGGGLYERMVRWYGGTLVIAGFALIPLGASLLYILATCRYMRDF